MARHLFILAEKSGIVGIRVSVKNFRRRIALANETLRVQNALGVDIFDAAYAEILLKRMRQPRA